MTAAMPRLRPPITPLSLAIHWRQALATIRLMPIGAVAARHKAGIVAADWNTIAAALVQIGFGPMDNFIGASARGRSMGTADADSATLMVP